MKVQGKVTTLLPPGRPPGGGKLAGASGGHSQSGVALAIVVWFIAGMSLLVAGIVATASVDARMAQLHVSRAKVSAAGDGGIHLFLADLVAGNISPAVLQGFEAVPYRLGELEVRVKLVPAIGLIDLNMATHDDLAALFLVAGGIDQADARLLADNVVNWRRPAGARTLTNNARVRFVEIEDLLRVEGVTRSVFDSVRDYVAAGRSAAGSTDFSLAPPEVLAVLQKSNPGKYQTVQSRRSRSAGRQAGSKTSALGGGVLRADADIRYGGRTWRRRRWVLMAPDGQSLLRWRMIRTEAPRVVAG